MTRRTNTFGKTPSSLAGVSRRNFVAGLTAGGVALTATGAALAACSLTATQVGGPFYPISVDADETLVRTRMVAIFMALFLLIAWWADRGERIRFLLTTIAGVGFLIGLIFRGRSHD